MARGTAQRRALFTEHEKTQVMKVKIQTDKNELRQEGRNILRDILIGCTALFILFILKSL
jgi:hypothetical protein